MTTTLSTDIEAGHGENSISTTTSAPSTNLIRSILHECGFYPQTAASSQLDPSNTSVRSADYVYSSQINRYPEGWSRLAAEQEGFENTAIHRKFGYLLQRCLLDSHHRLAALARRLFELDHLMASTRAPDDLTETTGEIDDGLAGERAPAGEASLLSEQQGNSVPQKISQVIQEIWPLLNNHHQMMFNEKTLRSLHEVREPEFWNRCNKIKDDGYLNEEEMEYLSHPDDFVSTATDPLWRTITGWMYLLPRWLVLLLFKDKRTEEQKFASPLLTGGMEMFCKGLAILVYAIVLLLPIIFLYIFPDMSTAGAVCLVTSFTLLFMAMMFCHQGATMLVVGVGACTYAAVLVAFLANLQG
ncbi:hypothetical protein CGMCC3_g6601 [Colletotrichum fructicola]|uniref:DUF6594 domain-containing protein n=1 Tax=Colletotrichum fructicola (strain Nara gc5) TaxID=1213859 RepID=A0A7J6JHM4_COLFN|nr:uncharacterized protein CGMCC3_g6601 [Colletotrichum fructicola]KAE9577350.1 hypothetical protein CGMCC3_g6601 [Colletotrichum fructicola]KAF4412089.1 hypothetical protein CFRS1_v002060 [Colletotrichum fructicola]KAF4488744.1 hypothetical protein CGGC5_v003555 [Colletotrichum fructicola Nara gc5]KAF5503985.1 hypothetical protein CGCF413_v005203 [Colletotrichum fructicola]